MSANVDLFVRVLAQIEKHPETWNQSVWDCGTAACFAGWTVRLGAAVDNAHPSYSDSRSSSSAWSTSPAKSG